MTKSIWSLNQMLYLKLLIMAVDRFMAKCKIVELSNSCLDGIVFEHLVSFEISLFKKRCIGSGD